MKPVLVVNADDFGLTPGVCRGVLRAGERGVVTSTSALVVGPAFANHAAALRDSGLGVGAHLCVVGEDPPLLSAAEVPSLVDGQGRFPPTWRHFLTRATRGVVDAEDLRRELSAQLDLLSSVGIVPTHVDSHQNLHLWPALASITLDLAAERGIGAVRVPTTRRWSPASLGVRALGAVLRRRASQRSFAVPDAAAGLDEAGSWTEDGLVTAIVLLGSSGVRHAELATHPGQGPDPDRDRYCWGYQWERELEALCAPAVARAVVDAGFRLGRFDDLPRPGLESG